VFKCVKKKMLNSYIYIFNSFNISISKKKKIILIYFQIKITFKKYQAHINIIKLD